MKLTVGLFLEYDGDDKKAPMVIFIHSMHEKNNYARNQF